MSSQAGQLSSQLSQTKGITPSGEWITIFLSSQKPTTPLPALLQTAHFRLLTSNITASLVRSQTTCFPENVLDVNTRELRLTGPIVVQVLSVEDISKSRWEQIEAIEAMERGEQKKGREIIRVTRADEGDETPNNTVETRDRGQEGPHKVLLQDASGFKAFGIELRSIDGINMSMSIGCKIILRNVLVARGLVLLDSTNTRVLGGKIDELHKTWREKRKDELKAQIQATSTENRN